MICYCQGCQIWSRWNLRRAGRCVMRVCSYAHDCACACFADVFWWICVVQGNHFCELTRQLRMSSQHILSYHHKCNDLAVSFQLSKEGVSVICGWYQGAIGASFSMPGCGYQSANATKLKICIDTAVCNIITLFIKHKGVTVSLKLLNTS